MRKLLTSMIIILLLILVGCEANDTFVEEKIQYLDEETYVDLSMEYLDEINFLTEDFLDLIINFSTSDRWEMKANYIIDDFQVVINQFNDLNPPPTLVNVDKFQKLAMNELQNFVDLFPEALEAMIKKQDFDPMLEATEYMISCGDYLQLASREVEKYSRKK